MKTRPNLTNEDSLLLHVKEYAVQLKKENIIVLIEKLGSPSFDRNTDLKKLYYEEHSKKYGF